VADAYDVFRKLRAEIEQSRFDFIRKDVEMCLTFAAVAEIAHNMGQRDPAERSLAKAEKRYSDMLRSFPQATGVPGEVEKELQSKFRQVRERLDGLQRLVQS
jgi:hypothetical protein